MRMECIDQMGCGKMPVEFSLMAFFGLGSKTIQNFVIFGVWVFLARRLCAVCAQRRWLAFLMARGERVPRVYMYVYRKLQCTQRRQ